MPILLLPMSPSPLQRIYDAIGADFLQTLSDGIAIIDLDTQRLIFVNRALAEMHGYSLENFIREPLSAIVHPDHYHTLTEILNTLQPHQCIEWDAVSIRQDGSSMPIEATVSHYKMNERPYAVFQVRNSLRSSLAYEQADRAHVKQATELEQALDALQKTQSQLIQSEKMSSLGQLVAGIAHEINNPINFIYGNIHYAQDYVRDLMNLLRVYQAQYPSPSPIVEKEIESIDLDFLSADLPRLFQSMQMGAERIKQIVLSLRTFSHMDEAEYKTVNIHEGIDSALLLLDHRIKGTDGGGVGGYGSGASCCVGASDRPCRSITLHRHYGTLPKVSCYPGKLNQVFMNVLTNAIDAIEAIEASFEDAVGGKNQHPSITITTHYLEETSCIEIIIQDTGIGMEEHIQKQIFDPFFTTKAVGKGSGMGLSTSYEIITERHQGDLICQSSVGEGSEFQIILPIRGVEG